ncbi:MAG: AMP-binding protein [Bacteroidetes bacterium]|nr:AMP-binding protein [Bacteroidota bacterium]
MFTLFTQNIAQDNAIRIAETRLLEVETDWERCLWTFIADWFNPKVKAVSVKTSGSTGKPKTILHKKELMRNSALLTFEALGISKAQSALLCLPASKISGMMMLVRAFEKGMILECVEPNANPLLRLDARMKIDFAAFTPMQFSKVISSKKAYDKAGKIKTVILGGEGISDELLTTIKRMKNNVHATFGMTETISHIALKKLNGKKADKYFRVLPSIRIAVNKENCLVVNAPKLGVKNLVTNDVVKIVSPTQFEWLGRIDNVINSGGLKIQPEEIESVLRSKIDVSFFIAGIKDAVTGEKSCLILEKKSLSKKKLEELKTVLSVLDKKIRPKEVWLVPEFVKTENRKLKRKETIALVQKKISLV